MNVYDFDRTIYDGDSTADFFMFCLRRHPKILKTLPHTLTAFLRWKTGRESISDAKETMFRFLAHVKNPDSEVALFWKTGARNIKSWYLAQRSADDLIITASPEFLVAPVCKRLGVRLIGTRVDKKTGMYDGPNCSKNEKVVRFREAFGDAEIDEFYSDSDDDLPLAKLATRSFKVTKNRVEVWRV